MGTHVYIDGFNLYYGALKGRPYKWLDLEALCRQLLPDDRILRIRYFTARITARPSDPQGPLRQDAYLRALATLPTVTVHEGHFLSNRTRMPLATPQPQGPTTVEVIKTEEKGSDVNLATYLLTDGYDGAYDTAVVLSNDSDLAEPIRVVKERLHQRVGIYNPHAPRRRSAELQRVRPDFYRQVNPSHIKRSQLPDPLHTPDGRMISKPQGW